MTLLDMIEFYNMKNDLPVDKIDSLYEDIELDERLDKDVLIGMLLEECGAMRCIYETTATFKYFSNLFFKKYKWNIGKLCDTMELKYDPLVNKELDWTEVTDIDQNLDTDEDVSKNRTRTNTGTQTTNDTGTQTTANTGTQTTNDTGTQTNTNTGTQTVNDTGTQKNEYSETEENTVSAMNSSSYEPDRNIETSGENERTDNLQSQRTDDLTGTRTDNLQSERTDDLQSERTDNLQSQRTDNLSEDIGETNTRDKNEQLAWDETDTHTEKGIVNISYQELIEKERKVAEFSVYNWIVRKYAKELFLLIY